MTPGWEAVTAAVEAARAQLLQLAPEPALAAEGEAYLARVLAAGLNTAFLGHWLAADGLYRAVPVGGGPNPDYILLHSPVQPTRQLRLEGRLNGSERVGVGLYAQTAAGALKLLGYRAFDAASAGPDGAFSLDLVPADQAEQGDTALTLAPEVQVLLVRVLHRDPQAEPARVRLSGGVRAAGPALATGSAEGALTFAARSLGRTVQQYLRWSELIAAAPNTIAPPPVELAEAVNAEPETTYFLGSFELAEGEWLEVTMPALASGYWSLHAYNYWFEHLQTPGVHDRNAVADADGRIRIAIGPQLPDSAANRIDTVGRRRGTLICRVIGAAACPVAALRC